MLPELSLGSKDNSKLFLLAKQILILRLNRTCVHVNGTKSVFVNYFVNIPIVTFLNRLKELKRVLDFYLLNGS